MRKIVSTIIAVSLAGIQMFGQNESFQAMRFDMEPSSAALAGSAIASGKSVAYAALKNASVLPFIDKTSDIAVSYSMWAPQSGKSDGINIGCGVKAGNRFGYSLAVSRKSGTTYDVIDDMGNSKGTFETSSMVLAGGIGLKITDALGLGINAKYLSETLSPDSKPSSFGADLFAIYHTNNLNVTAGLSSVGASVKDVAGNAFKLPMSVTAGVSYSADAGENSAFEVDGAMDYFFSGNFTAAAGAQYIWNKLIAIRAGYHYDSEAAAVPSYASIGAGLSIRGIHFDIAYLTANPIIGGSINIGVGYRF